MDRVELLMRGPHADADTTHLLEWLKADRMAGAQFDQAASPPKPGDMGAEWLPIITAIIGAPVLAELVKSLQIWLQVRKPRGQLTVKLPDGREITASVSDGQQLTDLAKVLTGPSPGT
jgi:hypothetical protein